MHGLPPMNACVAPRVRDAVVIVLDSNACVTECYLSYLELYADKHNN